MKIEIEWDLTGPLAHAPTRRKLIELVDNATSLRQLALDVPKIKPLATYRGGNHVAVHEAVRMSDGTACLSATRFALITE